MSDNPFSKIVSADDRFGNIREALQDSLPSEHFLLQALSSQTTVHTPILHGTHFDISKANDLIRKLEASQSLFGQSSAGAVLNVMSAQGITIGENYLIQMIRGGYVSQVKSLIKFGLDFSSARDVYQHNTALHTAVALDDLEIFNALLSSYRASAYMSHTDVCQSLLKKNKNNDSVLDLAAIRVNAKPGVRADLLGLRKAKALFLELAAILLPDHKQEVQKTINNIPHIKTKQEVQAELGSALSEENEEEKKKSEKNKEKNKKKRERIKRSKMLAATASQQSQVATEAMGGLDDLKDQEDQIEPKAQEHSHAKLVNDEQPEAKHQVTTGADNQVDLEAKKVITSKPASEVQSLPQSQPKPKVEAEVTQVTVITDSKKMHLGTEHKPEGKKAAVTQSGLTLPHTKPGNAKQESTKVTVKSQANSVGITNEGLEQRDSDDEGFQVFTRKKPNKKDKPSAAKLETAKKTNGHTAQNYRSGSNRPGNRPQNGQAQLSAAGKESGEKNGITQVTSRLAQIKITPEEIAPTEPKPVVQHTIAPWASLMKKPQAKIDSVAD